MISAPLQVLKSLQIKGAGGGPAHKLGRPVTKIAVAGGGGPAFKIEAPGAHVKVRIQDLNLSGGGIEVGGPRDPCRGFDDPVDTFVVDLVLKDVQIDASSGDAIKFGGGSLILQDVEVVAKGTGLYVKRAAGDISIQDSKFLFNKRWGIYICNREGVGQIFMNDVNAIGNGRGGVAIVGKGSPPSFRTVCMQTTEALFNNRFGVLLFEVAKTLLYNVDAGYTSPSTDPDEVGRFGDGISVASSNEVFFWDVSVRSNSRVGWSTFGLNPNLPTLIHLVGEFSALDNLFHVGAEGDFYAIDQTVTPTVISGVCGFTSPITAPPSDPHCGTSDGTEVVCQVTSPGLEAPDPLPDP
jgi:hypothetical protein